MGKSSNIDTNSDKYIAVVARPSTGQLWCKERATGTWKKFDAQPAGNVIKEDYLLVHPELSVAPRAPTADEVGKATENVISTSISVWKPSPDAVQDQDVINLNKHASSIQDAGSSWYTSILRHVPGSTKGAKHMTEKSDKDITTGGAGGFFETFISSVVDAGTKALPAVASQRAIAAGTGYLAKELEKDYPAAAAFLRSPGGQGIAGVLLPALVVAGATRFPQVPKAQMLSNVMQAGLDAGAVRALDAVAEKVMMPMMMVMLKAAGLAGELTSGTEESDPVAE